MPTAVLDTTAENIKEWFDAYVVAAGMGSKLISKSVLQNQEYEKAGINANIKGSGDT